MALKEFGSIEKLKQETAEVNAKANIILFFFNNIIKKNRIKWGERTTFLLFILQKQQFFEYIYSTRKNLMNISSKCTNNSN